VSPEELRAIEELVNAKVRTDTPVSAYELSYDEAQKRSDIKQFFGEKYGAKVRVIDIDFSKELCGGTHTQRLGTIGLIKLVKESSIAAGVRRIEAVCGRAAELFVLGEEDALQRIGQALKAPPAQVLDKLQQLLEDNKALEAQLKVHRKERRQALAQKLVAHKEHVGAHSLIAHVVDVEPEDLGSFAEELLQHMKSGVVAIATSVAGRCQLLIGVSQDLVQKNVLATNLIKQAAPLIQGGGGGKPGLAQAGGKNPEGLPAAFEQIRQALKQC
jgi:alanyl-tRNA synthetase